MFIYEPQFIADFEVNKIKHRKAREERKVFIKYVSYQVLNYKSSFLQISL